MCPLVLLRLSAMTQRCSGRVRLMMVGERGPKEVVACASTM